MSQPWTSLHNQGKFLYMNNFCSAFRISGRVYNRMRFEIDWASLIVGSKFTVYALFYFVLEGSFPSTSPLGAYFWRGDLSQGFLRYEFGRLTFGRRGLYMEGLIWGILA